MRKVMSIISVMFVIAVSVLASGCIPPPLLFPPSHYGVGRRAPTRRRPTPRRPPTRYRTPRRYR